jgi:hypothetical protein
VSPRPFAALLSGTFLFLLSTAETDDANWSTFGGAGAFSPNRQVRMERENVRIDLEKETIPVRATF